MPELLHPRLTICGYPLKDSSLVEDFEFFESTGVSGAGLAETKAHEFGWAETAELARRHRVRVDYVVCVSMFTVDDRAAWDAQTARLLSVLDGAAAVGARAVYGTTGPAGSLSWEEAASEFAIAVQPAVEHARKLGVALLVENQNPLAQTVSFVTPLADLVELAELSGLGVCVDLFHCWRDRGFEAAFRRGLPRTGIVQVGDYAPGIRQLGERVVPEDGIVPISRILELMLRNGYKGTVDLEITGPKIEAEGHHAAMLRGAKALSAILSELDPRPAR